MLNLVFFKIIKVKFHKSRTYRLEQEQTSSQKLGEHLHSEQKLSKFKNQNEKDFREREKLKCNWHSKLKSSKFKYQNENYFRKSFN